MKPSAAHPVMLELDDARWRSFVTQNAEATPFHEPVWTELLARTYGYRAFALAVVGDDGLPVAGAPFLEVRSVSRRRRWISLPFTDECPPLANDAGSRRALTLALAHAQEVLGAPQIDIRGTVDGLGWRTTANAVIHELPLERDVECVRSRFSRSQVIRNISRAQREGVTIRRAVDARDLRAFYHLHTRTRRRQGVPVQPKRFFELLWAQLVEPGLGFILLAHADGPDPVAGALFLTGAGATIYKFGASDTDAWRLRPNHLIFWTAIQEACARGDCRFDFGRSDLGNSGLRAFKTGWGATERALRYSTLLPGAAGGVEHFAARATSVMIRKGPGWLCRGTGEALYRYAATR